MDQNLFRERAEMRKLLDQELQLASQDKETHLNLLQVGTMMCFFSFWEGNISNNSYTFY